MKKVFALAAAMLMTFKKSVQLCTLFFMQKWVIYFLI